MGWFFDWIYEMLILMYIIYVINLHYYFLWKKRDSVFGVLENMFPSFYKRNEHNIKWIYNGEFIFIISFLTPLPFLIIFLYWEL